MKGRASAEAEALARAAHAGQVDKVGRPYIEHPQRVAARVRGDELLETVAWLHDVVEDTPVTLRRVHEVFGPAVAGAVDALTRRAGEASESYYARVKSDPLALEVKRADLADNTDPARSALLDPAERERLAAKYALARAQLGV